MLSHILKPAQQFMQQNASNLLTGVGVSGVFATAVLASKATLKAKANLDAFEEFRAHDTVTDTDDLEPLTFKHKVKLSWHFYIPTAMVAGATVVSIVMINRVSARDAAAMAAAYKVSQDKYKSYRTKVEEKLGKEAADDISNEVVEERLMNSTKEVMIQTDQALFLDALTGRYFMSSILDVTKAQNTINHEILTHGFASLGMFYAEIDLPQPDISEDLGWNSDTLVDLDIGTTKTPDHRPAFVLTFVTPPKPNYGGSDLA